MMLSNAEHRNIRLSKVNNDKPEGLQDYDSFLHDLWAANVEEHPDILQDKAEDRKTPFWGGSRNE